MEGGGASAETSFSGRKTKRIKVRIKIFLKFGISISLSVQPRLDFEIVGMQPIIWTSYGGEIV